MTTYDVTSFPRDVRSTVWPAGGWGHIFHAHCLLWLTLLCAGDAIEEPRCRDRTRDRRMPLNGPAVSVKQWWVKGAMFTSGQLGARGAGGHELGYLGWCWPYAYRVTLLGRWIDCTQLLFILNNFSRVVVREEWGQYVGPCNKSKFDASYTPKL